MTNIMIIESPGKVKKLTTILGAGWKVYASVGHIRDLPSRDMGVAAPDFKPQYELSDRGKEVVGKIKAAIKPGDTIYLATDPDREGESISWHLQQALRIKEYHRVTFNEITERAVKEALKSPRRIDGDRVAAQEARRVLDRLVGYTVSPKLSDLAGEKGLSAGRVQSPALRLVVDRENEIRNFVVVNHFGVKLKFKDGWHAAWSVVPDFAKSEHPYVTERSVAEQVKGTTSVEVVDFSDGQSKRSPPPPFTTSTMQQIASRVLGMNPKRAMEVAQKLYEGGYITYHRTDNPNLSDDSMPDVQKVVNALGLKMHSTMRKFKAPDGAQVGHPAITPTHWDAENEGDDNDQRRLYKLIRDRAIACQLEDAVYAVRQVTLKGKNLVDGKSPTFKASGRKLISQGWLKLTQEDKDDDGDGESSNPIPTLNKGDVLSPLSSEVTEHKTTPPSRYTEGELVKKLESEGIGRPATYASIMDNLDKKGYVRTEKKFLLPTGKGEMVINALKGVFSFVELEYTRDMEKDLDDISERKATYRDVVTRLHDALNREMSNLKIGDVSGDEVHPCPTCGKPLRRLKGKFGYYWGCSDYPHCKTVMNDDDGKPVPKENKPKPELSAAFTCPDCGSPLAHRVKEGVYNFWACSNYPKCTVSMNDIQGEPNYNDVKRKK